MNLSYNITLSKARKLYFLLIILSLGMACHDIKENAAHSNIVYESRIAQDSLFRNTLYLQKGPYKRHTPIHIYSTLEYIGNGDSIEIHHMLPFFHHIITNDEGIHFTEDLRDAIDMATHIKKGDTVVIPFAKSRTWSENDPKASYWYKFTSDPELKLPKGKYIIEGKCYFHINGVNHPEYSNDTRAEITVE